MGVSSKAGLQKQVAMAGTAAGCAQWDELGPFAHARGKPNTLNLRRQR